MREFVKKICCAHRWGEYAETGRTVEVCGYSDARGTKGCGAMCVRDKDGKIVEYDRLYRWGNPVKIEELEERPARKAA